MINTSPSEHLIHHEQQKAVRMYKLHAHCHNLLPKANLNKGSSKAHFNTSDRHAENNETVS